MRGLLIVLAVLLAGCVSGRVEPEPAPALIEPQELVAAARARIFEIDVRQLESRLLAGGDLVMVDVREPYEFDQGHIPGAVNIPRGRLEFDILDHPLLDELRVMNASELPGAEIVLYCRSGGRGALAAQSLQQMGFRNVVSLMGGYGAWQEAGRDTSNDQPPVR